jgi:hypothetical protein
VEYALGGVGPADVPPGHEVPKPCAGEDLHRPVVVQIRGVGGLIRHPFWLPTRQDGAVQSGDTAVRDDLRSSIAIHIRNADVAGAQPDKRGGRIVYVAREPVDEHRLGVRPDAEGPAPAVDPWRPNEGDLRSGRRVGMDDGGGGCVAWIRCTLEPRGARRTVQHNPPGVVGVVLVAPPCRSNPQAGENHRRRKETACGSIGSRRSGHLPLDRQPRKPRRVRARRDGRESSGGEIDVTHKCRRPSLLRHPDAVLVMVSSVHRVGLVLQGEVGAPCGERRRPQQKGERQRGSARNPERGQVLGAPGVHLSTP